MWNNFTLLTKSGINVLLLPRTVLPKNWGQPTYSFVLTWYKNSFLKKCLPPCRLTQQKIAFHELKIRKTSRKLNFSLNYTRLLIMYLGGFDLWKKFPKIQILCLFKLNFQLFNPFAYIIICFLFFMTLQYYSSPPPRSPSSPFTFPFPLPLPPRTLPHFPPPSHRQVCVHS